MFLPGATDTFKGPAPEVSTGRVRNSPTTTAGINYPSPFFDIAATWLPQSFRELFRWCRYFFLTNPTINTTIFRLAEYPITDLVVEHEDPAVRKRWTDLIEDTLQLRNTQVEIGLDYNIYGNSYLTLHYPFIKYLTCRSCHASFQAKSIRKAWRMRDGAFWLTCPRCKYQEEAHVHDMHVPSADGIRIVRWNPENVEVVTNEVTGENTYHLKLSRTLQNDVQIGKRDVVEKLPQIFIQAVRERTDLVLRNEAIFHIRRPSLPDEKDRGIGIPVMLPLLKDAFYIQIMKKSQESVLLERIVPLNAIFPQAGSASSDIFTNVNLKEWRTYVASEIAHWKRDSAYIPIMPIPIGSQTIGGDGKALLLVGEIQAANDQLIIGMGFPPELIRGNMQYSGGNVMLRQMENTFERYLSRQLQFVRWIIEQVSNYMNWPKITVRHKPMRMADDIQRKALLLQLRQLNVASDTTLLTDMNLSPEQERETILAEIPHRAAIERKTQLENARLQNEVAILQLRGQLEAQKLQQAAATPFGDMHSPNSMNQRASSDGTPAGMDIRLVAQRYAQSLAPMPPEQQQQALAAISQQSPDLASIVKAFLQQMGASASSQQGADPMKGPAGGIDARPLPDQLPPRRELSSI